MENVRKFSVRPENIRKRSRFGTFSGRTNSRHFLDTPEFVQNLSRIERPENVPKHDRFRMADGFIISGKATNQLIERYRLRIPPTSTKSERSPIRYLPLPNEILDRIFHYHKKNEGEKLHPLLLVNKRWYYIARRLILQKIVLTGISGIKFTKALSKDTKPVACEQVLGLKFIGEINIKPDVYISEVCKACPNLQRLSFENSGSHILKNKNLETLLVECPNLKSLVIRSSRRLSPKTITKLPKLAPSLEKIVIRECLRIRKDILTDFQNLYPKIKLIFEEE
ncbi:unnamed protein product [Rhizophagus irregularis]|nr:unnamed protein product [Rhizophagus irregularis]